MVIIAINPGVLILASKIPSFVTTLGIYYFGSSCQKKNKKNPKTNLHERFHTVTKF